MGLRGGEGVAAAANQTSPAGYSPSSGQSPARLRVPVRLVLLPATALTHLGTGGRGVKMGIVRTVYRRKTGITEDSHTPVLRRVPV